MNELKYSKLDSNRFGLVIYRARMEEIDAQLILSQILEHNIDTAIIRIPTTQLTQIHKLEKIAMPFMITDTLAYYEYDLLSYEPTALQNDDLEFVVAQPSDHATLNHIVRETFVSYVNHYRMNPFFDNENVTEGYQDWVRSYAENDPTRICWLVKRKGEVVAFATFNLESEFKIKGILYGVKPSERGGGIFQDIMRYAKNYGKAKEKEVMQVTTQIENLTVQRAWTRKGFTLHHTSNTIHINAMLTKSVFDNFNIKTVLESEDFNPKKVSNRHILRQINYHFDYKQNIVTQNHQFVNIKTLQPKQDYTLRFSFPVGNKGLLRVLDNEERETYMLVYFDLRHFLA